MRGQALARAMAGAGTRASFPMRSDEPLAREWPLRAVAAAKGITPQLWSSQFSLLAQRPTKASFLPRSFF